MAVPSEGTSFGGPARGRPITPETIDIESLRCGAPEFERRTNLPAIPPDVNLLKLMDEAKRMSPLEFRNAIASGGSWDYKKLGRRYEPFGDFLFGLLWAARGFPWPRDLARRGAGWYQKYVTKTSQEEWGEPWDLGPSSFGDDPNDQCWIERGFESFDKGTFNHYEMYQDTVINGGDESGQQLLP